MHHRNQDNTPGQEDKVGKEDMKKITVINHTTSEGNPVEIKIERIYGTEKVRVNLDGDIFKTEEFQDCYYMDVVYDGKTKRFCHIQYDEKAPGGRYIRLYGRDALCLPAEKWEEVDKAINERLTEELSPFEVEEIEDVKEAIENGRIMPKAELDARCDEYNRIVNEGGSGFNPYFKFRAKEYVERVMAKFPEHFKNL